MTPTGRSRRPTRAHSAAALRSQKANRRGRHAGSGPECRGRRPAPDEASLRCLRELLPVHLTRGCWVPWHPGVCHGAPGPPLPGPGVSAQHSHWSACPPPPPGTIAGALALAEPPTLDRETAPKGCRVPLPGTSGCVLLLGVGLLRLPRQIPKTPRAGRLKQELLIRSQCRRLQVQGRGVGRAAPLLRPLSSACRRPPSGRSPSLPHPDGPILTSLPL